MNRLEVRVRRVVNPGWLAEWAARNGDGRLTRATLGFWEDVSHGFPWAGWVAWTPGAGGERLIVTLTAAGWDPETMVTVASLTVTRERWRRQGFGSWLVGYANRQLTDRGVEVRRLVAADNPASLGMLQRAGMVPVGVCERVRSSGVYEAVVFGPGHRSS